MRWFEIFHLYNLKRVTSSGWLYAMMGLSLLISVAVSLGIPQIITSSRANVERTADAIVGADIKVVAPFDSPAFEDALARALSSGDVTSVTRRHLFTSSVLKAGNNSLVVVADNQTDLASGEVAVGRSVADRLGVRVGDTIDMGGRTWSIKRVDDIAGGLDETANGFGYVRANSFEGASYAGVVLLTSAKPDAVAAELKRAEPDLVYVTSTTQRHDMLGQLNANLLTLTALSTMCTLTTILSLFTCVVMILRQRQVDTAIMRMLSVRQRVLRLSFMAELWLVLLGPIVLGAALSPLVTRIALAGQGIPLVLDLRAVALGCAFFAAMYLAFVYLVSGPMAKIDPLAVLKGGQASSTLSVAQTGVAVTAFTAAMLLLYSTAVLGNGEMFRSSVVVMLVVAVFFLGVLALIKVTAWIRWPERTMNFAGNQVRVSGGSTALTVVSMALLLWFILFGFGFSSVFSESYNGRLDKALSYNYMVTSKDAHGVATALRASTAVKSWTSLYVRSGVTDVGSATRSVSVAAIDLTQYQNPFVVLNGKSPADLASDEALVSERFAGQTHIGVGDTVTVTVDGGTQVKLTIAGVYDSGTVNDAYLLTTTSSPLPGIKVLDLVQATDSRFLDGVTGASVADLSNIGAAFNTLMAGYLDLFKSLCLVCVVASVIFNFNLIQLKYVDRREVVVVSALGISKSFLGRAALLRMGVSLAVSVVLAVVLFQVVAAVAVGAVLGAELIVPWDATYLPAFGSIALLFATYLLAEVLFIRRAAGRYDVLREQV